MSRRPTAFTEEDLANASDPADSDYDNKRAGPAKRKRPAKSSSSKGRKRPRHQRSGYGDDSDIEDDEDDLEEDSLLEDSDEDSDASEPVLSTRTGRPMRKSTQGKTFRESSIEDDDEDDDQQEEEDDDNEDKRRGKRSKVIAESPVSSPPKPTLLIKLPIKIDPITFPLFTTTRSRRGSSRPQSALGLGQRRSSRQAHNEEEPLFSLTDSGRHAQITRAGSATPEPSAFRATHGGKRMPATSAIIEASQEGDTQEDSPSKAIEEGNTSQVATAGQGEKTVAESVHDNDPEDDDEDEGPVSKRRRISRDPSSFADPEHLQKKPKRKSDESSDFAPEEEEEEEPDEEEDQSPKKRSRRSSGQTDSSNGPRRSARVKASQPSRAVTSDEDEIDFDELAEEAQQLNAGSRKRTRRGRSNLYDELAGPRLRNRAAQPDYRVFRPELMATAEEEDDRPTRNDTSHRGRRGAGATRSLFTTFGPFGGAGGPLPLFSGTGGFPPAAAGGADSDSSDDETGVPKAVRGIGGGMGMTPTSAFPPQQPFGDPAQATGGGPANFGKTKDKTTLADADPLGVNQTVSFSGVGGLDDHINQLKEMVLLPLLYPELFQQFKITPPRGVLFHGPPGTGKTLLARALSNSVSQQGRKVTFYMRKGADALSKWVGEAERQLRLLFEEARKNQPSIIFFDEIDGLAPVRSSKQEQIHSSIVATLLALMDGMDGRGQVIVIGATNRPDSVDPALRRPGRFDREFYFPLPSELARRSIIDIHTKGWDPPLQPAFKEQLAKLTKGYGGADLRALCTEAALNAIQGTYPQVYKTNEKLVVDPTKIRVLAKDFMISVNKMIPSSERTTSSGATPLETSIEPLLRDALNKVTTLLEDMLPTRPKLTALEEAEYDDRNDEGTFDREMVQQKFDKSRVFRPRLLVYGQPGMGQQHLANAILHKFERLFVQSFSLQTLFNDSTRSPEAAVTQLFQEVRRHKPSVIFIPDVNIWYDTVGPSVVRLLAGLLRSLPPSEPVLVFGIMELGYDEKRPNANLVRDLFGYSKKSHFMIDRIGRDQRQEYYESIVGQIRKRPDEFPDLQARKKRKLEELPRAPAPKTPEGPTREQIKAQRKTDRHTLNMLKIQIQPIMDQINRKYRKFRLPIIDENIIQYLFNEQDPNYVAPQVEGPAYRPYELRPDNKGVMGLRSQEGKFFYNLDIVTIEKRLSNGYYKRPKDFLDDIKRLAKDAKMAQDEERTLRANELVANVEVDMQMIEANHPWLVKQCEEVYQREKEREKQLAEKSPAARNVSNGTTSNNSVIRGATTTETSGPVTLGEAVPGRSHLPGADRQPLDNDSSESNGNGQDQPPPHERLGHDDVQMTDDDQDLIQDPTHPSHATTDTQAQRSQQSGFMQLATNSQPADYHNSASTTTSGHKTSDKSSGPSNNTQSTNGVGHNGPMFEPLNISGGSDLPDTQEMHYPSSQSQQSSQAMGPPQHRHSSSSDRQHSFIIDESAIIKFHQELVHRSSGCTVEQLEQLNAAMMDSVWRTRTDWNRNHVLRAVMIAFNEMIEDIEYMQKIAANSQPDPSTSDDAPQDFSRGRLDA